MGSFGTKPQPKDVAEDKQDRPWDFNEKLHTLLTALIFTLRSASSQILPEVVLSTEARAWALSFTTIMKCHALMLYDSTLPRMKVENMTDKHL